MSKVRSTSLLNNSEKVSKEIFAGFQAMFKGFLQISNGAQHRFERADWAAVSKSMQERQDVYKRHLRATKDRICLVLGGRSIDLVLWLSVRQCYETYVAGLENGPLSKTFFNSVFGAIFGHETIRNDYIFITCSEQTDKEGDCDDTSMSLSKYNFQFDSRYKLRQILLAYQFSPAFENIDRDVVFIESVINSNLEPFSLAPNRLPIDRIDLLPMPLFRNKAAYLLGRIVVDGRNLPFTIALMNNIKAGLYVDAFVVGEDAVSIIFSFTHAYFMAPTDRPIALVNFLSEIMPNKKRFELFNSLGFTRHAKTEFYRFKVSFTRSLSVNQQYKHAVGTPGMVMLVFTLESSDYVYKVIKDQFSPPKDTTREEVVNKYNLVKRLDRIGRMADVYEFHYLAFNLSRFNPELLNDIKRQLSKHIVISGSALVFKHIYVERKMTPLNIYIKNVDDIELERIITEYGDTIKQLAYANIFPGDMLLKNFGVTRHGRVVFYDYDEICQVTDCHFRKTPQALSYEEELSSGVWYDVAPGDVFPEQFQMFFSGNKKIKDFFCKAHSDIFTVDFWLSVQQFINHGHAADVFPYRCEWRSITRDVS